MDEHNFLKSYLFFLEERNIWTGTVVHGRQEKEEGWQKEKGNLSEGDHVHNDLHTPSSCCNDVVSSSVVGIWIYVRLIVFPTLKKQ